MATKSNQSGCGLVLLGAAILASCADAASAQSEAQMEEPPYGTTEQQLTVSGTLWPNGEINVCWVNGGLGSWKDRLRVAIDSTWGTYGNLTITWPDDENTLCDSDEDGNVAPSMFPVFVHDTSAWGGTCAIGSSQRLPKSLCGGSVNCQCAIDTNNTTSAFALHGIEYAAVHEFGHGFGMMHEHQRLDRPSDILETCLDNQYSHPTNDPDYWASNPNYQPSSSTYLTVYDGVESFTTYCFDPDHDGVHNSDTGDVRIDGIPGAPMIISPLDQLGIEMAYPFNFSRRPVAIGGITNFDGTSAIIRSSIATTFTLDWLARGGHPSYFTSVAWRMPYNFWPGSGPTRSMKFSSPISLGVEATDVFGRNHVRTWTAFTPSDAQYNAVLGSSANYLLL